MRVLSFILAALWLFATTLSVATAQPIMGEDHCNHASDMAADTHAVMDHHKTDHSQHHGGHAANHEKAPHDCDTCCDGACLCKAYCGSQFAALTPMSLMHSQSLTRQRLNNAPSKFQEALNLIADPPPRSVA